MWCAGALMAALAAPLAETLERSPAEFEADWCGGERPRAQLKELEGFMSLGAGCTFSTGSSISFFRTFFLQGATACVVL